MPTPHIKSNIEDIAENVLLPGDPLRAKYIAEHYLTDYTLVNDVRNILAYTGYYKNTRVTVFSTGMGIPSMAIYAYELMNFYDVKRLIRIGSVGTLDPNADLLDIYLVKNSITDSNFSYAYNGTLVKTATASKNLNNEILQAAKKIDEKVIEGNIFCSDAFYQGDGFIDPTIEENHCLGIEMESFALLYLGQKLSKETATILSVSNSLVNKNEKELSSKERETGLDKMILLALESLTNNN